MEWVTIREEVSEVLDNKVEEFMLFGYELVTSDELWNCLMEKKWRKKESLHLYEIVNDILTLSPQMYMSYVTVQMYRNT